MLNKARTKEVLGVDDRLFLLLAIPVTAFSIPLLFFNESLDNGLTGYLPKFIVSLVHTALYWFSIRGVFIFLRRRFPSHKQTGKRLLYTAVLVLVLFNIISLFCHQLESLLGLGVVPKHASDFEYSVASFTVILLCSSVYEGIFLYHQWKRSVIETERLKRQNVQSQLEGLKSQVNPHFLFNSLNTLSYLIPEDTDKALKFVQKLSKVYRYILEIRDKKLISLEEELEFLYSYIFLLKERYGNSLSIDISIPEVAYPSRIVPLSLQILFENAIKHNVISADKPLFIDLFVKEDQKLYVRNNLQKKRLGFPSTKVGLQNIRNRYAYFTDEQVEIIETTDFFLVCLPLIQVPAKFATVD